MICYIDIRWYKQYIIHQITQSACCSQRVVSACSSSTRLTAAWKDDLCTVLLQVFWNGQWSNSMPFLASSQTLKTKKTCKWSLKKTVPCSMGGRWSVTFWFFYRQTRFLARVNNSHCNSKLARPFFVYHPHITCVGGFSYRSLTISERICWQIGKR